MVLTMRSASYAIISYRNAWLKRHYPACFFAVLLSTGMSYYPLFVYTQEAVLSGTSVLAPDINRNQETCTLEGAYSPSSSITPAEAGESAWPGLFERSRLHSDQRDSTIAAARRLHQPGGSLPAPLPVGRSWDLGGSYPGWCLGLPGLQLAYPPGPVVTCHPLSPGQRLPLRPARGGARLSSGAFQPVRGSEPLLAGH